MSGLPIRVRLSAVFAAAMAVVLVTVGAFVYFRLQASLDEQLDAGLRAQADAVSAEGFRGGERVVEEDESFAQVLGPDGSVVHSSHPSLREPLAAVTREPRVLARESVPGLEDGPFRILAVPAEGGRTVVVGASLEDRDEALGGLLTQLLIGGPIALALATLAAYVLAGAVLRPVDELRRGAAEISAETTDRRLPLPRARDEILRLGETLNEMLARLQAGLARERRFVADASHELRTPLALLRTELELALRRPRSADELRSALRSAVEEVDRLTGLAEDLLVLARADEGKLRLRREPLSVDELLESVAMRFAARAAERGRTLATSAAGNRRIAGDRLRLEQALGNLVDNALRHGAGTIRLEAERRDGGVAFRVSDEGPGFPSDLLPRAFDRFTRGDEARASGGAGLGLAIVSAVAQAHGGAAEAANRPGAGAVVSLLVPDATNGGTSFSSR